MTDAAYALSAVDKSGRVADRSIVRTLGWPPGTRLDLRVRTDVIVVCSVADGICTVDDRGYLVLPLAVRRRCHLAAGDRVLLAAHYASGVMVAFPLPVLDRLLVLPTRQMGVRRDEPDRGRAAGVGSRPAAA